jgi:hypothetical protein
MRKAIEKAVYYQTVSNNFTVQFDYTDEKSFQNVVQNLNKDIDVITFFAPKDDFIYTIFKELGYMYKELFLDKVECLYLINRKNIVIRIGKSVELNNVNELNQNKAALLNVDSVLSEYYQQKKECSFFKHTLCLFLGGFAGSLAYFYISLKLNKE